MDETDADTLRKEKECVAKSGFNVEEVKLWRDIFSKFDADGNGQYDMGETKKLLQAVGINLNERTMHEKYLIIFQQADLDEDRHMDFPEFLLLMKALLDANFGGIATRVKKPDPEGSPKMRGRGKFS